MACLPRPSNLNFFTLLMMESLIPFQCVLSDHSYGRIELPSSGPVSRDANNYSEIEANPEHEQYTKTHLSKNSRKKTKSKFVINNNSIPENYSPLEIPAFTKYDTVDRFRQRKAGNDPSKSSCVEPPGEYNTEDYLKEIEGRSLPLSPLQSRSQVKSSQQAQHYKMARRHKKEISAMQHNPIVT